jgi:hypothetical protein
MLKFLYTRVLFYNKPMTEFTAQFRDDELDLEDRLLRSALADLQATVTNFMQRNHRSINELTEDEQQALVDSIDPHLKFEFKNSPDFYEGMPIVVRGVGAFLMMDAKGLLVGAQVTATGDVITGTVSDVQAFPVPTRELVLSSALDEALPVYDQSLSAVIIIEDATFHSQPSSDGTYQITHDLGGFLVVIPVVYNMDTRVADSAL